jgi:hypothetical protein
MNEKQGSPSSCLISSMCAAFALVGLATVGACRTQAPAPEDKASLAPEALPTSTTQADVQPSPSPEAKPTPAPEAQPTSTSAALPAPPPTSTRPSQPTAPTGTAGATPPATPASACDPSKEPNRQYTMRDPNQCKAALFRCADGKKPFFNSCGCGCE